MHPDTTTPYLESGGRRIYRLESRGTLQFLLEDLLSSGALTIIREVEDRGLLQLRFQREKVVVAAGGYIGLIPLTSSIAIEVLPKLPVRNLARVLEVAGVPLQALTSSDRTYRVEVSQDDRVLEFLAANLVEAVRPIESEGLHKAYERYSDETSHPSGRISVSPSLQKFWSKDQAHKVIVGRFGQTSDIPHNRVVRAALEFVSNRIRHHSLADQKLKQRLSNALRQFPGGVSDMRDADIQVCRKALDHRTLPTQRHYYYRALDIALLVLESGGIALRSHGGDIELSSFILDFDDLFEKYIRRSLQRMASGDCSVQDGNREGKRPLFLEKKEPSAQPDILIRAKSLSRCFVGDVKYRDVVKREDINQVVTYAVAYSTGQAGVIHQTRPGTSSGLRHVGTVGTIRVFSYGVDLDAEDLPSEERKMAAALFSLVGA